MVRGSSVSCPLCEWSGPQFDPAGRNGRPNASCPRCHSLERHRAAFLYLRDETELLSGSPRVLHFAPEPAMAAVFESLPNVEYVSTDIEMPGVSMHMDIESLLFRDGVFDLVICSHVLEHVGNDIAAMREIGRVLAEDGIALIMVPQLANPRETTQEDPLITEPAERERVYGQGDHVRAYGTDFPDRVRAAGMEAEVVAYPRQLGEEATRKYALTPSEQIFVCRPVRDEGSTGQERGGASHTPVMSSPRPRRPFIRTISPDDPTARSRRLPGYYRVGLEALRLVEDALATAALPPPSSVLDIPCGFGRVTRMLRMGFPDARITAWDRDPAAVEFCVETFGVEAAPAGRVTEIALDGSFELIWCPSLLTHLPVEDALALLDTLARHLDPNGVMVLTAMGETVASLLAESRISPAIEVGTRDGLLERFRSEGFAFEPYRERPDRRYGISLASADWVGAALAQRPGIRLLSHEEAGWDGREDVFVCSGAAEAA
jgi:SAM-dependent methyltransferase